MSENGPYEIIETCTDVWVNGPGIDTSLDALTIEFLNTAYSEGCKSRDSEVSALTSERDRLKAWNDELERISNERSNTIDRILSERNGLEERVKELEDALKYMADGRNWESGRGDFFAFLLPGHCEYGYPPSYAKKALGGKP